MDNFNVPKKVNRHVLKAINLLSNGNSKQRVSTGCILKQVKYQMRNLAPVADLDGSIMKSLKNLCEVGLIDRHGANRYSMARCCAPSPLGPQPSNPAPRPCQPGPSTQPDRKMFRNADHRKRSRSKLDPNLRNMRNRSDESMSGDDLDRTRKRMRSNNKQLKHTGRTTVLPRARHHYQHLSHSQLRVHRHHAAVDMPLLRPQDLHVLHTAQPHRRNDDSEHDDCWPDMGSSKNSSLDYMLATVTPVSSVETTEISNDVRKIIDVREIVVTPSLKLREENEPSDSESEEATCNKAAQGRQTRAAQTGGGAALESKSTMQTQLDPSDAATCSTEVKAEEDTATERKSLPQVQRSPLASNNC